MNDPRFAQQMEILKRLGAATVHEALGQRGYVDSAIAPLDPASRIAGRACTVDSKEGDNLMMHVAVDLAEPGRPEQRAVAERGHHRRMKAPLQ